MCQLKIIDGQKQAGNVLTKQRDNEAEKKDRRPTFWFSCQAKITAIGSYDLFLNSKVYS